MAIDHELDPHAPEREKVRAWLQEYRRRAGLTQRELAIRLNISRATIDRWESGVAWPRPQAVSIMNQLRRDVNMERFPPVPRSAYKFLPTHEKEMAT